jgi:hypothetical protein
MKKQPKLGILLGNLAKNKSQLYRPDYNMDRYLELKKLGIVGNTQLNQNDGLQHYPDRAILPFNQGTEILKNIEHPAFWTTIVDPMIQNPEYTYPDGSFMYPDDNSVKNSYWNQQLGGW